MAAAISFGSRGGTSRPSRPRRSDALVAMDVGRDDRGSGGHRLEQHDPERLAAGRRRDVDVGRPVELGLLLVADPTEELDALEPARRDVPPGFPAERTGARDEEPAVAAGLAQDPVRLEQLEEALARLEPAHEEQVPRPVLPARERDGPLERVDIDAVRDDLVLAGEVAVDEVLRSAADRDPAVEPGRLALHHLAPELVRGREAAVGVERGDVHAGRQTQDDRRQERHERLVEVEQVELLALEHRPDLGDEPRRQGDRPDRAVDRQREALADPDDVPLRRPLEAVRRRDDPDVVAAQAKVLVQVPDVLGHAAWQRIDVRRDEADLHRP